MTGAPSSVREHKYKSVEKSVFQASFQAEVVGQFPPAEVGLSVCSPHGGIFSLSYSLLPPDGWSDTWAVLGRVLTWGPRRSPEAAHPSWVFAQETLNDGSTHRVVRECAWWLQPSCPSV